MVPSTIIGTPHKKLLKMFLGERASSQTVHIFIYIYNYKKKPIFLKRTHTYWEHNESKACFSFNCRISN